MLVRWCNFTAAELAGDASRFLWTPVNVSLLIVFTCLQSCVSRRRENVYSSLWWWKTETETLNASLARWWRAGSLPPLGHVYVKLPDQRVFPREDGQRVLQFPRQYITISLSKLTSKSQILHHSHREAFSEKATAVDSFRSCLITLGLMDVCGGFHAMQSLFWELNFFHVKLFKKKKNQIFFISTNRRIWATKKSF